MTRKKREREKRNNQTEGEEKDEEIMKQFTYDLVGNEVQQARYEEKTKRIEHITDGHSIVLKWLFSSTMLR